MQVKIGVLHTNRELVLDSDSNPDEVENAVRQSVEAGAPLRLADKDGSTLLVPVNNLAYVEIGAARRGGVGFGSL